MGVWVCVGWSGDGCSWGDLKVVNKTFSQPPTLKARTHELAQTLATIKAVKGTRTSVLAAPMFTHTHTCMYIYVYICVYIYMFIYWLKEDFWGWGWYLSNGSGALRLWERFVPTSKYAILEKLSAQGKKSLPYVHVKGANECWQEQIQLEKCKNTE